MYNRLNKGGNDSGINKTYYLQLAKGIYKKDFSYPHYLFTHQFKAISE